MEEMMLSEQLLALRIRRDELSTNAPGIDTDSAAMRRHMDAFDERRSEIKRAHVRQNEMQAVLSALEAELADRVRMIADD
jgi:hypothetical protein